MARMEALVCLDMGISVGRWAALGDGGWWEGAIVAPSLIVETGAGSRPNQTGHEKPKKDHGPISH